MKAISYMEAVQWIALNDHPENTDDGHALAKQASVRMVCDLMGFSPLQVCCDIVIKRKMRKAG